MKQFFILFFLFCLTSCDTFTSQTVKKIQSNPEQYREPNSVNLDGTIIATQSILGYTIGQLRDDEGDTIYFVTKKGANNGDKITLKGHYASLAKFSLLNVSGIIED